MKAVDIIKEQLQRLDTPKLLELFGHIHTRPAEERTDTYRMVRACVLDVLEGRQVISFDMDSFEYIFPEDVRVPLSGRL